MEIREVFAKYDLTRMHVYSLGTVAAAKSVYLFCIFQTPESGYGSLAKN